MDWLPSEHSGIRTGEQAARDLLSIARASHGLNEAHVTVDPDEGEAIRRSGFLTTSEHDDGSFAMVVDGVSLFEFDPGGFRGAWLLTYDAANYYSFALDTGWGRVALSDAYNGLGASHLAGGSDITAMEAPVARPGFRDVDELMADLEAIAAAQEPLNEVRLWTYEPKVGGVISEGKLALGKCGAETVVRLRGADGVELSLTHLRGAWLWLDDSRYYLNLDLCQRMQPTLSGLLRPII